MTLEKYLNLEKEKPENKNIAYEICEYRDKTNHKDSLYFNIACSTITKLLKNKYVIPYLKNNVMGSTEVTKSDKPFFIRVVIAHGD